MVADNTTTEIQDQNTESAVASNEIQTDQDPGMGQSFEMPEKFRGKSAEDIARAYTESERSRTQAQQERAALAREAEQLRLLAQQQAILQQQLLANAQPQVTEEQIFRAEWEVDPVMATYRQNLRAEQRARAQTEAVAGRTALEIARKELPDFDKYQAEIANVARELGHLVEPSRRNDPSLIKVVYDIARARHMKDEVKAAEERGLSKAGELRKQKDKAFGESSSGVSSGGVPKAFSDLSLEEMRKKLGYVDRE